MKSLNKYALLALLAGAAIVDAQPAGTAKASSPAELRLRLDEIKKAIDADNRHVLHLQALARKDKDVIKLTCINDKLVQIKAQLNLFDTTGLTLDAAITNSEDTTATVSEMETVGTDVKKLRGEADVCAGELEMYKQESKNDTDRPDLDDPTDGSPFEPGEVLGEPEIDVPGFATPYK